MGRWVCTCGAVFPEVENWPTHREGVLIADLDRLALQRALTESARILMDVARRQPTIPAERIAKLFEEFLGDALFRVGAVVEHCSTCGRHCVHQGAEIVWYQPSGDAADVLVERLGEDKIQLLPWLEERADRDALCNRLAKVVARSLRRDGPTDP